MSLSHLTAYNSMGNSVFWISQGGEGFLQQEFIFVVDYLSFMISREQRHLESGFVNLVWTETSDVQS